MNNINDQVPEEMKKELENNPYVLNNRVNYMFILKHFGDSVHFLNEILQTEGIIPQEHEVLREIAKRKAKWESKASHWMVFIYGAYHLYKTFSIKSTSGRMMMLFFYIFVCFDVSYSFGRCLGGFLTLPKHLNQLMNIREGRSIHALQTRLFVKRCVYNDISNVRDIKSDWSNSLFLHQLFDKPIGRFKKYKASLTNIFNSNFNPNFIIANNKTQTKSNPNEFSENVYSNSNSDLSNIKIK